MPAAASEGIKTGGSSHKDCDEKVVRGGDKMENLFDERLKRSDCALGAFSKVGARAKKTSLVSDGNRIELTF